MDIKRSAMKEAEGGCNYANPNSKLNHILSNETIFEGRLLQGFALGDAQKTNGKCDFDPCRVMTLRSCMATRGRWIHSGRPQRRGPCRLGSWAAKGIAAGGQKTKRWTTVD